MFEICSSTHVPKFKRFDNVVVPTLTVQVWNGLPISLIMSHTCDTTKIPIEILDLVSLLEMSKQSKQNKKKCAATILTLRSTESSRSLRKSDPVSQTVHNAKMGLSHEASMTESDIAKIRAPTITVLSNWSTHLQRQVNKTTV